jgi:dihydrofolate reductase
MFSFFRYHYMIISLIAAMDRRRLIGNNNQLPWHLPVDFAHFKSVTMGKPVVMGRKTFASIGRALPGRQNIVLSKDTGFTADKIEVARDLDQAIALAGPAEEIMVIGGSTVYQLALPRAQRIYLTVVEAEFAGDAWFPELDPAQWSLTEQSFSEIDDKNAWRCRFQIYEKLPEI